MKHHLIAWATAALVITSTPALAEVTDFGQGTQIGRYSEAPELSRAGKKSYREFRKKAGYFGAFAANSETGVAFYVMNFHSLELARSAAMEGCEQLSQATGCGIYAVALPESLPITTARATGLSEAAADAMHSVYREHRKPGKFAAFAVSGASHFGYANAWDSAAYAKDTALAHCEKGVASDMVWIGPMGRDWARARKLNTCRVISVEQTPTE